MYGFAKCWYISTSGDSKSRLIIVVAPITVVEYNNIRILNCQTKTFRQESVYDASGTDLMYYKFTVRVIGYVHGHSSVTSVQIFPTGQGNATDHFTAINHRLGETRQKFVMRMGDVTGSGTGGTVILKARAALPGEKNISGVDVNNGPRCNVVEITHITGGEIFRVEAEFEICKVICDDSGNASTNSSAVLSNRWSVVDSIDNNRYTTRTFQGRLRCSTARLNPMEFRNFVVPSIQPGFRRDSATYMATEDGLHLDYTIIDKEIAYSAPVPATKWNYKYTESTGDATTGISEVSVTLEGPRDVSKHRLIRIAVAIVETRLFTAAGQFVVEHMAITDEYGDDVPSRIHVEARVKRTKELRELRGVISRNLGRELVAGDFGGGSPGYDSNFSKGGYPGDIPEIEGPVPLTAAFHAYLQTPCDNNHKITSAPLGTRGDTATRQPEPRLSGRVVETLPDEPVSYTNPASRVAMYTNWQMESKYHTDYHMVQLPIADRSNPVTSGAPTSIIVPLAMPTTTRTIKVRGSRVGSEISLPGPVPVYPFNGGTAVLIDFKVLPKVPDRSNDGQRVYEAAAEYVYAITHPPTSITHLPVGLNGWESLGVPRFETGSQFLTGPGIS